MVDAGQCAEPSQNRELRGPVDRASTAGAWRCDPERRAWHFAPFARVVVRAYDLGMERLSLSLPEDLAARIRDGAAAEGASVSAWLARAAESQLLSRNASNAIADWERDHSEIAESELAAVERA